MKVPSMYQRLFSDFSFRKGIGKEKLMYIAKRRLWALPAVAIAMLLVASALFFFSSAAFAQDGGTVGGDYCVEGLVIDWEEQPMEGITVTLTTPTGEVKKDETDDDDDAGEFKFEAPDDFAGAPGIYTVEVTLPGDDWEGVTSETLSFYIGPGQNGCIQVRFKLRQIVPVTVYKIDSDHNPLENWTIDAVPGGGNFFAEPQSEDTDATGAATFTLTPGVWIFMERQPDSDDDGVRPDPYSPVVPQTGRMEVDVQPLGPNDPAYVLVFKNEFKNNGCISIRKFGLCEEDSEAGTGGACADISDPQMGGFGVAGWEFSLERSDGTIARQGVTDAEGYVTFDGLPYGPYTIVEEKRAGWGAVSPRFVDVTVTDNECVMVPFINQQDDSGYCIEGYKKDVNGNYGIPDWKITIEPVDDGGYDPDDIYTDGRGKFRIDFPANDYRIPGSEFEVCEDEDEMDGWLPVSPTCQIVKLPMQPGECVRALDFVNEQVGHSQATMVEEKRAAMAEHMQENAPSMDQHDGGMNMSGGAMWGDGSGMGCASYHVVKAGEGLFDIGMDNGVSAQAMVNANPDVKAPNYTIFVGQKICIP